MSTEKPSIDPQKAVQAKRPELPKRFYKAATVGPSDAGFALLLDGRTAKTPGRKLLAVPDEGVAEALVLEWEAQTEFIDPAKMPLTRMVNTALDRVGDQIDAVRADVVKHAGADLICYRAEGPEALIEAENAAWNPLLDWAREDLGARLTLSQGIVYVEQDEAALTAIAEAVQPFDALGLTALHVATTLTGSAIIALALARGRLSLAEAWAVAHVDEDWQMSLWGRDEAVMIRRAAQFAEMEVAALILERGREQDPLIR